MSSTNSKRVGAPHRYRKWMSAATAAALVAGSATMTLAAPRGAVRADRMQARAVNFQWQAFAPKHIVHIETPASQGPLGNMNTEALRAPAVGFAWQMFSPKHLVTNERPGGSNPGAGLDTDALRLPAMTFAWQAFRPPHFVSLSPANGTVADPNGFETDAMRTHASRPSLVLGVDGDGAGGFRTNIGLSFRLP